MSDLPEPAPNGFVSPPLPLLVSTLLDLASPIAARMRAIFYLRTLGGAAAVTALCSALRNKEGTTLFRHEVAYVLGQMQSAEAVGDLLAVLRDTDDDPIVRHESAEALGAIADPATLAVLDAFTSDACSEVAETCSIAAARVRSVEAERSALVAKAADEAEAAVEAAGGDEAARAHARASAAAAATTAGKREAANPYDSVDPAPSASALAPGDVPRYGAMLLDASLPLFERYKAMFSLRNAGSKSAVLALCAGFSDPSPLFRHEVAYVLGQLAHPASVPALKARTQDGGEHDMVRHEAAEALGAIGTGECVDFLQSYTGEDVPIMLRESCVVALDVVDYWSGGAGAAAVAVA